MTTENKNEKSAMEELEKIVGRNRLKEEIKKRIRLYVEVEEDRAENINMNIILTGNPGTGKTTIARLLGKIYYEMGLLPSSEVIKTNHQELVAEYVGQTVIKTQDKINEAMGKVLFIDEADKLYHQGNDNSVTDYFGKEALETLMKAMENHKGEFAVIFAGYDLSMKSFFKVNKGLKIHYFPVWYVLEDYSASELMQIFELMLNKKHMCLSEEFKEKLPVFFENFLNTWGNDEKKETWCNAREVENLIKELEKKHSDKFGETVTKGEDRYRLITMEHLPQRLQELLYPADSSAIMEQINEMAGLNNVKEKIKRIEARIYYQKDKKSAGHYIFKGNPGTGKTAVAHLMGKLFRSIGALKRGHVAECTAKQLMSDGDLLDRLVKKAKNGIFFIDEAYQLAENERGFSVLTELIPVLENQKEYLTIILAGHKAGMEAFIENDKWLLSKFPEQRQFVFEDYNIEELTQILKSMAKKQGYNMTSGYIENFRMVMSELARNKTTRFENAHNVRNYLQDSVDELNLRLRSKYGDKWPAEDELYLLTEVDIARPYRKYVSVGKNGSSQEYKG